MRDEGRHMIERKKSNILIVDDEKANVVELTNILNTDYKVSAVIDSREAVETAEETMPDIILLDVVMPEMSGYDVIIALKSSEKTKGIPVIFITGLDSDEDEERGLTLGAMDYISKPFHAPIVKIRIRNQIRMLEQFRMIERLSMLDQLTELPNRRSLEAQLNMEWRKALREQKPISILMIDIDKFKNYNDEFGHQQGDAALVAVAGMFRTVLKRPGDFAARWGGEEFIALLPNTNAEGALEVAEQMRSFVENMEIPCQDGRITKITLSVGVNTQTPEHQDVVSEFIRYADEALYEAKRKGRNQVCLFTPVNSQSETQTSDS